MQNRNRPPSVKGKAVGIGCEHAQYTTAPSVSAIVSALGLKPCGRDRWQGVCPACGYADAFSLTAQEGLTLWHCHACGDADAIRHSLQAGGLWGRPGNSLTPFRRNQNQGYPPATVATPATVLPTVANRIAPQAVQARKLAFLKTLWAAGQSVSGTVAARYLQGRGIRLLPDCLRFLPECRHTPSMAGYPALIAAVRRWPSEELSALHRTYLKPDGSSKIDHPQARMMLGDAYGGAVRLAFPAERLGIAEGVETALSVQQPTGLPMWACLSTSGLQNVMVPDTVQEVVICADYDAPGLKAAHEAAERLSRLGKRVKLATPPQAGTDFNDMLKGGCL